MNKACKIICIIAAAALGLGILLAGIGYFFGGANSVVLDKSGFRVIDNNDKDEMDIVDETFTDVKNINVKVSNFNKVILREGDSFSVKGSNPKSFGGLEATLNSGTLTVMSSNASGRFNFSFGLINQFGFGYFGSYKHGDLEITFPAGTNFGKVELDIDTAKVEISKIKADRIETTLDIGDLSIEDTTSGTLIVDSDTGDISLNNVEGDSISIDQNLGGLKVNGLKAEKVKIECDTGDVDIKDIESNGTEIDCNLGDLTIQGVLLGKSVIGMDTGSVDLTLRQSRDETSYIMETDLGTVNINGNKSTGLVENRIPGAKNSLSISNDMGDIKVSFN